MTTIVLPSFGQDSRVTLSHLGRKRQLLGWPALLCASAPALLGRTVPQSMSCNSLTGREPIDFPIPLGLYLALPSLATTDFATSYHYRYKRICRNGR